MTPTPKIDFSELFKIRPRRNASIKHEIIKLLIVLGILDKYKRNLYWIRIYTEFSLGKKITDVYFENLKTKEIICYEIQRIISPSWLKETSDFYKNYEQLYFKTDWVLVKEFDMPDDIHELKKEIDSFII